MWDGTSFVDLSNPRKPKALGFLETTGGVTGGLDGIENAWRDVKIVDNVAYIGSEVTFHGMQTFDLTRLRDLGRGNPKEDETGNGIFSSPKNEKVVPILEADYTAMEVTSSHNIVTIETRGEVMAVGLDADAPGCTPETSILVDGGTFDNFASMVIFDIAADPVKPPLKNCVFIGQGWEESGYVHDAQCINYHGPDPAYQGVNICVLFMESEIILFNMDEMEVINEFSYAGAAYVHQGWFSEGHDFLYTDDEADEVDRTAGPVGDADFSRCYIFDLTGGLEADPGLPTIFVTPAEHPHIDHNLHIKGDLIYQAAYTAGARIRRINPDYPGVIEEVAYFDGDDLCKVVFGDNVPFTCDPYGGTWTFFPYFDSGIALAGSSPQGLYILRPTL